MGGDICLGGTSALECWRKARRVAGLRNAGDVDDPRFEPLLVKLLFHRDGSLNLSALPAADGEARLPNGVVSADVESARNAGLISRSGLTQLYVAGAAGRRYLHNVHCSVMGASSLCGTFHRVGEGLIVPGVAPLLMNMAATCDLIDLVALLSEFCGLFVLAPNDGAGFLASPALLSVGGFRAYLDELQHICLTAGRRTPKGMALARKACDLAFDRAASPAELICALLLTLPGRLGGYGLPRPELNGILDVGGRLLTCDLLWREERVVLEYQGAVHVSEPALAADRNKSNVLREGGYAVIQAGKEDFKILPKCDRLVRVLSRELSRQWRSPTEAFRKRQTELRHVLLADW